MLNRMQSYEFDRFTFDPADGRLGVVSGPDEVHLRPKASVLLGRLLAAPQTVIDRETLVREIWGEDAVVDFESGLAALLREVRQAIQALGGDPALIETVPRRGYRLRTEVRRRDDFRPGPAVPQSGRRSGRRRAVTGIAGGIGIALAVAAAVLAIDWPRDSALPAGDAPGPYQLAILPLDRFGDPGYPPVRADILLADAILAALWRAELGRLELIGRAGMRPYAGRQDVVAAIAADLGVDLLMEGSVRVSSGGWQVDLRLLQVPPGRVVWSYAIEGEEPALPTDAAASELVERLAEAWPELRKDLNSR